MVFDRFLRAKNKFGGSCPSCDVARGGGMDGPPRMDMRRGR